MISRDSESENIDRSIKETNTLPVSFTDSVFNSAKEGFYTGLQGINKLNEIFGGKPDQNIQTLYDTVQQAKEHEADTATFGQKATRFVPDFIANGIGMALNPATAGLILSGDVVAAGVGKIATKVLPTSLIEKPINAFAGTILEKYFPKTVGELGKVTTHGGAIGAIGFGVPDAVINEYNADTKSINWGGAVEDVGINGAIGALLGIPGYAAGVFFKGIFEGKPPMPGEDPQAINKLDAALAAGKISKEEHEWGKMFYEDPHNPQLQKKAAQILQSKGHNIDSAKLKAFFGMISEDDWKNLSATFPDQLTNAESVTNKTAMSDFILGNSLDKLRENPELIDGLRGTESELDYKLKHKDEKLKEADAIVDQYLHVGMQDQPFPFNQHDLFDFIYKERLFNNEEDIHIPFTVPEEVEKAIESVKKNEYARYKEKMINQYHYKRLADAELTEKEFYHGSNSLNDMSAFDVDKSAKNSLYGAGLYLTDRKDIAMGYGLSAGGVSKYKTNLPGKIFKLRFKEKPKLIDVERRAPEEAFKIIQKISKEHGYDIKDSSSRLRLKDIYKKMRDDLSPINVDREYYADIGDMLTDINHELEKHGFDGFTHVGGQILGQGKKLHNVVVLFGKREKFLGVEHTKSPARLLEQKQINIAQEFKEALDEIKNEINSPGANHFLLDPKQELSKIHEKLVHDGLPDNWKHTKEYARLVELADVWKNAKTLLDRIELEAQYKKQQAYKDLISTYLKVLDSTVDKFANHDSVMQALKDKISKYADSSGENKPQTKPQEVIKEEKFSAENTDEQFSTFDEQIKKAEPKGQLKEDYQESKDRYKQFEKNESALEKMLDCLGR